MSLLIYSFLQGLLPLRLHITQFSLFEKPNAYYEIYIAATCGVWLSGNRIIGIRICTFWIRLHKAYGLLQYVVRLGAYCTFNNVLVFFVVFQISCCCLCLSKFLFSWHWFYRSLGDGWSTKVCTTTKYYLAYRPNTFTIHDILMFIKKFLFYCALRFKVVCDTNWISFFKAFFDVLLHNFFVEYGKIMVRGCNQWEVQVWIFLMFQILDIGCELLSQYLLLFFCFCRLRYVINLHHYKYKIISGQAFTWRCNSEIDKIVTIFSGYVMRCYCD